MLIFNPSPLLSGASAFPEGIPLADVVRFKEQQWFVEELEASREGDANAMLRLAKVKIDFYACSKVFNPLSLSLPHPHPIC